MSCENRHKFQGGYEGDVSVCGATGMNDTHPKLPCGYYLHEHEPHQLVDKPTGFVTKDSGERAEYDSGMVRDTESGKPRYDLMLPLGVPYEHQFLTRIAELLARGAEKYNDRNWEKAAGTEELERFKSSGYRHFMQWMCGEVDEDHAAAVVFNLLAYETTKYKLEN